MPLDAFLRAMGDSRPPMGQLFITINTLEAQGLITVYRIKGVINTLSLTELGAERAREAQQEQI